MGSLTIRITPASTSPLVTGNLGVVVPNKALTTLENIQVMFERFKAGAPSLTSPQLVPNTTVVRCDVNPVAATGTFTAAGGASPGTLTAIINGISIAVTGGASDTASATLMAAAINASTNALVTGLVTATSALGVVTVSALPGKMGNAVTTTATGTGFTAEQARLTSGTDGTAQVAAVKASGTYTLSTSSGILTATINGQAIATASLSGTDTENAAALATAILTSEAVGVRGVVTATSALGVVTVTALLAGTGDTALTGNGITTTASGTGNTADQTKLAGGLNAVSTWFTY